MENESPFEFVELFCGKGNVTRSFKDAGFTTWSFDKRKRLGVCMPDFKADILHINKRHVSPCWYKKTLKQLKIN